MRVELPEIYGDAITLINRLDAKHAALKQDVYYATILRECMWSDESKEGTSSSGVVTPTTIHKVQIPKHAGTYANYSVWRKLDSRSGVYTLRTGDYIVRGEITEDITAANIRTIIADYEPNAFQVRSWRELTVPDQSVKTIGGLPVYRFVLEG